MRSIDLNCDLGESGGPTDEELLRIVSSANVACGFHAGDPALMRRTVRLAHAAGVGVGAHPGFRDAAGFGRREMRVSPREVEDLVLDQIGAFAAIASTEGVRLRHVKAHGALYNMAVRDRGLAEAIVKAVAAFDASLVLFGLPGSELLRAAAVAGLSVAAEGFADRSYEPDGSLTPRSTPGAVIDEVDAVVRRGVRMAAEGKVIATDGSEICVAIDTICVHGDTPGAPGLARALKSGLERAGVAVRTFSGTAR